jgi:hypothetical protein
VILEQLDHRGRVVHRLRLGDSPVSVGRAYDNDVIVDDPYVDPHHLRIEPGPDGRLEFRDLDSRNGTWEHALNWRMGSAPLKSGMELRIGRTVLRFAAIDQPVPRALADHARVGGLEFLLDPKAAVSLIGLALLAGGLDAFLGATDGFTLVQFLTPGLAGLVAAAIWAGGWAFANRLVVHRFRFLAHLAWAALIGVILLLVRIGAEWLDFFFPTVGGGWVALALDIAVVATLLAGHLWLVTEWDQRRRWRVALGVTALLAAILALLDWDQLPSADQRIVGQEALKPVSGRLVPARTADDFFRRARSLETEVDRLTRDEDR